MTDTNATADQAVLMAEIAAIRSGILDRYVALVRSCDIAVAGQWGLAVWAALAAGVPVQALCVRFSCGATTVRRWEACRTSPPPGAREAMKATLVDLVEALRVPPAPRVAA